jgi:hypothetical protein
MRSNWTAGNESMAKSYISWCEKSGHGMLAEQLRIMLRAIRWYRAEVRRCHVKCGTGIAIHCSCPYCKTKKGT